MQKVNWQPKGFIQKQIQNTMPDCIWHIVKKLPNGMLHIKAESATPEKGASILILQTQVKN